VKDPQAQRRRAPDRALGENVPVRRPSLIAATLALAVVVGVLVWALAKERDDQPDLGSRIVVPAASRADEGDRAERRRKPKQADRDRRRRESRGGRERDSGSRPAPSAQEPSGGGAAPPVTPPAPLPTGDDDDAAGDDDDGDFDDDDGEGGDD
jgi:hypothetical protein